MPTTKRGRNYLKEMTLTNARLWFRYGCKIIDHIKGNNSSMCTKITWNVDYAQAGKKHLGAFRKIQLHKEYEEKSRSKHKGRQNSTMEENNQSFKRYI